MIPVPILHDLYEAHGLLLEESIEEALRGPQSSDLIRR